MTTFESLDLFLAHFYAVNRSIGQRLHIYCRLSTNLMGFKSHRLRTLLRCLQISLSRVNHCPSSTSITLQLLARTSTTNYINSPTFMRHKVRHKCQWYRLSHRSCTQWWKVGFLGRAWWSRRAIYCKFTKTMLRWATSCTIKRWSESKKRRNSQHRLTF